MRTPCKTLFSALALACLVVPLAACGGGKFTGKVDKDGAYEANVTLAQNATLMLKVEKDGFEKKEEKLAVGTPQTICIAPTKK
jgi:hypothetical protein